MEIADIFLHPHVIQVLDDSRKTLLPVNLWPFL